MWDLRGLQQNTNMFYNMNLCRNEHKSSYKVR